MATISAASLATNAGGVQAGVDMRDLSETDFKGYDE
jgi:hypothetical protein